MQKQRYSSALFYSLLFHLVVLALFIVSVEFSHPMAVVKVEDNNAKVISAIAVNAPPAPVDTTPVATPVTPTPPKKIMQPQVVQKLPPKPKAIAIPTKIRKKDLAKELLADLQNEAKKHTLKKEKSLEKAMEQEMKEQAAKSLQQQLLAEQKRAAGAKALGIVNKYKALIVQAISRRWLVPAGADKKLYSELMIHLAPGGAVLDVQVAKSSGDVALDRSARDAVFKASPLPVPNEDAEFEPFRQFVLKVRPENVVVNDA